MIVQIYTSQTVEEAATMAEMGVDHIGLTPETHFPLPGSIDYKKAREIRDALQGRAKVVALSVHNNLKIITEMAEAVKPDIIQLCADLHEDDFALIKRLKNRLPGTFIMQAIPVGNDPAIVETAVEYSKYADFLILDSVTDAVEGIGAAGVTHDWQISKAIVERSECPVVLAGGLSPGNVVQAIKAVSPWGVDSLTKTNKLISGNTFCKDLDMVKEFTVLAKGV